MQPQQYGTFINVDGEKLGALKTAPERYESSVIGLLRHVSRFKVGWHVLNEIKKTGKQVLIRPAGESGDGAYRYNIVRFQEKVYHMPHRFGQAFINFDPEHPVKPYLPRALVNGQLGKLVQRLFPYHVDRRWKAEDLLVHELFHALRILLDKDTGERLNDGFRFVEELYAILVANMYRSEQRRDHELRGSWSSDFEELVSTNLEFRLKYDFWIRQLESEMGELTAKLRALPMNFNPFRVLTFRPPCAGHLLHLV